MIYTFQKKLITLNFLFFYGFMHVNSFLPKKMLIINKNYTISATFLASSQYSFFCND